ncbi:transcriptional repressor [Desulfolithobacter dissulfuricans]|uniref:Ferric uptake regulation protein n=1 Tax=Desulfolithobacter dissulfuricans TaxID=2795293 RepID=A0A915U6E4_9BACT|nr:Fur family transcriptional regulator [Desulfolithobacter dissulfuricans]BCO10087.1 transcriptional repressor [Desulfolithobacter dissulfuricans]
MPVTKEQIARFEAACRTHGLKITQQRLEIYRTLHQSTSHPSAEALYRQLVRLMPTLSLDTVYRTLATFEELGLVKRVETTGNQSRFEARTEQHHHFFCDNCGQLLDFTWPTFDSMPLPDELEQMGQIREKNLVLHGLCSRCLAGKNNNKQNTGP